MAYLVKDLESDVFSTLDLNKNEIIKKVYAWEENYLESKQSAFESGLYQIFSILNGKIDSFDLVLEEAKYPYMTFKYNSFNRDVLKLDILPFIICNKIAKVLKIMLHDTPGFIIIPYKYYDSNAVKYFEEKYKNSKIEEIK